MNEHPIRWDDLQVVLAIAESGSLSGAGRQLGVSHATVFRRLTDMERRLGVSLFHRNRSGYSQTPAGEDLAASAARIQQEVFGAERRIAGEDLHLAGTIRLTTTDTLFSGLLAGLLADFRERHPAIELEVVISNQQQSLTKREADLAIRPTNTPPETLVGRRVGRIKQAVYGRKDRWKQLGEALKVEDLMDEPWIGPDSHMGDLAMEHWVASNVPESNCRYRLDSVLAIQIAIGKGSGVAVLPCYLGDADDQLHRITEPLPELETQLWMLTHQDLRRVTRIKTLMKDIGDRLKLF